MTAIQANRDLHTHSTASDGTLSPTELVLAAQAAGVSMLSLTDHDTVSGLAEARAAAIRQGIKFVPGVELSVSWEGKLLHVVGLQFDPEHAALGQGLREIATIREHRAKQMGQQLSSCGIPGAYEGARREAGGGQLTRTHFARHLVNSGYGSSVHEVFKRFLLPRKPGYVATVWPSLERAITWIHKANGVAVLAHPMRYGLTEAGIRRALLAFRAAGGIGIEVICAGNTPHQNQASAAYAVHFGLLGSVGSDYHGPGQPYHRVGHLPQLPEGVEPVWSAWQFEDG